MNVSPSNHALQHTAGACWLTMSQIRSRPLLSVVDASFGKRQSP
jgi:hypothetical protein